MISIIGFAKDLRTNTNVVYAKTSILEYLKLIGEEFGSFEIQRSREGYKTYERLKEDIKKGALLPPITLAVKLKNVNKVNNIISAHGDTQESREKIAVMLSKPSSSDILDGLQRTYILRDIFVGGSLFDREELDKILENQTLLLEFWLEPDLKNLIYRIIVLNAGQKPMSLRHQIEILSHFIGDKIKSRVPGVDIETSRQPAKNNQRRSYALSRIAAAYQCFLTKSPDIDKNNLVAQKLTEDSVLDMNENDLNQQLENFVSYFEKYNSLVEVSSRYQLTKVDNEIKERIERSETWLTNENVMQSIFAAIASVSENQPDRIEQAVEQLEKMFKAGVIDPLGISAFKRISGGIDTRRFNVGFITRRTLFSGFKEFFRDRGETPLSACWTLATE